MRHITYTTCFDEVLAAVVPNLPDHIKPCPHRASPPSSPRAAEAGGDYLSGFSELAVRWIEIGINSLSFYLLGLTLFVYGLALALGAIYPRWVGWIGGAAGAALIYNSAVVVAYKGFVTSISGMVGLLFMTV
jgi:hypothetical protein